MGSHRADHRGTPRARKADQSAPALPTVTTEIPVVREDVGGKRRALKHVGRARTPLAFMPSLRAAVGVTVLAIAAGGVVTSPQITATSAEVRRAAPNALAGNNTTGNLGALERDEVVSRGSERGENLTELAEQRAAERDARLGEISQSADAEAEEIGRNAWVIPLQGYRLTARFGQYGLWSSAHTGLDFAAPYGTPIHAVAGGTVTSAGYDGAYGNKTVITLEDGTEMWYAHQSTFAASYGQTVRAGDLIGYVGSTGNSTGAHLHLEVRPGGGDPVDPYAALVNNGVTP